VVELLACPDDVPTLENFAYGDTPTRTSLESLVGEILGLGEDFDVSLADLATRHDVRPLVLRTALTYLELLGVLRHGTPFYAGYQARLLLPLAEIVGRFSGERAAFLDAVFARAKRGRAWYSLDPRAVAEALGQERSRVVAALEYLAERGLVELRAADARQRYTRLDHAATTAGLVAHLAERFAEREAREVDRLRQVLDLVTLDGCQVNALVGHFGERREAPCGHCSWCETHTPARLPPPSALPSIERVVDRAALLGLSRVHPSALGAPRQRARFLCGLTSPATAAARLGRHPLFGALAAHRFADVLHWCEDEGR
jgi:ATP-dependent DNA helicase RecQ